MAHGQTEVNLRSCRSYGGGYSLTMLPCVAPVPLSLLLSGDQEGIPSLEARQRRRSDQPDARSAAVQACPRMTVIPHRSPVRSSPRPVASDGGPADD
jgi:hypothetical protein